jgi:hypothetical protein
MISFIILAAPKAIFAALQDASSTDAAVRLVRFPCWHCWLDAAGLAAEVATFNWGALISTIAA